MARSTRAIFRNMQGRTRVNFNWDAISQDSAVVVTAALVLVAMTHSPPARRGAGARHVVPPPIAPAPIVPRSPAHKSGP